MRARCSRSQPTVETNKISRKTTIHPLAAARRRVNATTRPVRLSEHTERKIMREESIKRVPRCVWRVASSAGVRIRGAQERVNEQDHANRSLNFLHSAAILSVFRMAETTQMRRAPAARTSSSVWRLMPPMANHGAITFCAAQRTYSAVTGLAEGLVPVE